VDSFGVVEQWFAEDSQEEREYFEKWNHNKYLTNTCYKITNINAIICRIDHQYAAGLSSS
jgi:hypothetical protein